MRIFILLSFFLSYNITWATGFENCKDAKLFLELNSSQCAIVKSPLTYQDNSEESIELFVRKFPSLKTKRGSIWLIAGGPGESGASFYKIIDRYRSAFPNLDIFIPDHRGTGASSAICPEESSGSVGGKNLVGEEWGTCFSYMYSNTSYVKAFSISNAAKDLRLLINNMSGTGKRYIYGVSYGTQLALRLAHLENVNLDGIILDSLVPMQNDSNFDLSKRSQIANMVGHELINKCKRSNQCSGKSSDELKIQLSVLIEKTKSIKDFSTNLPEISLTNFFGALLDIPSIRNEIPNIIISLSKGDVTDLIDAVEATRSYYEKFNPGYENFGSSIPLVQVITASENNLRSKITKVDLAKETKNFLFTSPLPNLMAENRMPTYDHDIFYSKLPVNLPKTLILHGTLDSKTHYDAAKNHATKLAKADKLKFVNIIDAPHFIALNAPSCFKTYVDIFIDGGFIKKLNCQDKNVLVEFE